MFATFATRAAWRLQNVRLILARRGPKKGEPMKRAICALAALVAMAIAAAPASASTATVYDASYSGLLPGNLPSVGAEAYSFNEFGDQLTFDGTARTVNTIRVTMSSWACEQGTWFNHDCVTTPGDTFSVPITLNIYNQSVAGPNGTVVPGSLIAHVTKSFSIPYRPTANLQHCNNGNGKLGEWWSKADASCYNGKDHNISFNLKSLRLVLPDTVVIGIAYNTTDYGYNPIGQTACNTTEAGCPYDSLNIALGTSGVLVGSKQYPDTVFQDAVYAGDYCDGGAVAQTNVFNLDSPDNACWGGYTPAIRVVAH
jgi:hypothetical protein